MKRFISRHKTHHIHWLSGCSLCYASEVPFMHVL